MSADCMLPDVDAINPTFEAVLAQLGFTEVPTPIGTYWEGCEVVAQIFVGHCLLLTPQGEAIKSVYREGDLTKEFIEAALNEHLGLKPITVWVLTEEHHDGYDAESVEYLGVFGTKPSADMLEELGVHGDHCNAVWHGEENPEPDCRWWYLKPTTIKVPVD